MNDTELRQSLSLIEMYKVQLDAFAQQAQILQMSLEETLKARDTMKAFLNAEEGEELLIPVGGASFIPAKVTASKKAVVGIGSRISAEKDLDDAVEYMDRSLKEIGEALKKTGESIGQTEMSLANLSMAVQQEYQGRRQ